jgi:SH3-like domain-containing protein
LKVSKAKQTSKQKQLGDEASVCDWVKEATLKMLRTMIPSPWHSGGEKVVETISDQS